MAQVYSLAHGAFGRAAQSHFEKVLPTSVAVPSAESVDTIPKNASAVVLFSAVPCHDLCERLTEVVCANYGLFVPAVVEGRYIVIGPVTGRAGPGCWRCWHLRTRQHDPAEHYRSYLAQYYVQSHSEGPTGYLDSIAAMTAGIVLSSVATVWEARQKPFGLLQHIDMVDLAVRTSTVTAVNGCPYCGPKQDRPDRTIGDLIDGISHLWNV